jgi:hypothetical protein
MKDANYAPMYCAMYPELARITRKATAPLTCRSCRARGKTVSHEHEAS